MAAAPLLAAAMARMDQIAWAGFAANGVFYGGSTGFANMTYVLPGTWLEADLRSGLIERRRFSTDTGGVLVESLPASAAEECGDALMGWWQDLGCLSSVPKTLSLSGGRDSRVVAAYALASGADVSINTYSPPSLDADLAERLVSLAGDNIPFVRGDSRKEIECVYSRKTSFLNHAVTILRDNNPDICVQTFMDRYSHSGEFQPYMQFSIYGAQGEIAHPYYYQAAMVEAERQWEGSSTQDRPSVARFASICDRLTTKAWGVTEAVRAAARERLIQPRLRQQKLMDFTSSTSCIWMYI